MASMKANPPIYTVVHGQRSCGNRYLVLSCVRSYNLNVMVIEMDSNDYVIQQSPMGTVYGENVGPPPGPRRIYTWDFAHRESTCKANK